jgi:hypothetical protein
MVAGGSQPKKSFVMRMWFIKAGKRRLWDVWLRSAIHILKMDTQMG